MSAFLAILMIVGAAALIGLFLRWVFTNTRFNDGEDVQVTPFVTTGTGLWRSPTVATTVVQPTYYNDPVTPFVAGAAVGALLEEELEAQRRAQMYSGYVEVPVVPPVYPIDPGYPSLDVPVVPQYDTAPVQLDVPAVPQYNTAPPQLDVPYVPSSDTSYSSQSSDLDVPSYSSDNSSTDTSGWSQDSSSSYDSGSSGGWD